MADSTKIEICPVSLIEDDTRLRKFY